MDDSLFWTIIGGIAGVSGSIFGFFALFYAWRQFRLARAAVDRNIDVQLWRHGDRTLQAYITLRNGGMNTAIMDRIEVRKPRRTKVAWHFESDKGDIKSLQDPEVSSVHKVRVIAEPGKAVGCGMVMELPRSADRVPIIKMRARIFANDLARSYFWRAFSAKPSMATDHRALDQSMGKPRRP